MHLKLSIVAKRCLINPIFTLVLNFNLFLFYPICRVLICGFLHFCHLVSPLNDYIFKAIPLIEYVFIAISVLAVYQHVATLSCKWRCLEAACLFSHQWYIGRVPLIDYSGEWCSIPK